MRAKIPQLREALASRFQIEHHGIMVAQHLVTLDAPVEKLSERTELVLARTSRWSSCCARSPASKPTPRGS
jgi:hypothetical protein